MTKNKFLKELDKSLYVLAEVERNDIINEYRDIIEEKVKHGKTEKEAVLEFGSIEELSREILSAYKVNPDYSKKDDDFTESAKKLGNDFDSFVKKGAKKATEFTKEVVEEIKTNNNDITIEFVFELLLKGLATLIIMFIASLPFLLVRNIGETILNVVISPLNSILIVIWSLLLTILFIGFCGLIFIAMFKQYFKGKSDDVIIPQDKKNYETKNDSDSKEVVSKSETKTDSKIMDKPKKEKTKQVSNPRVKKQKNGTPLLDIFLAIAKAVLVVLMLPLIFFNIANGIGIAGTIYLMIKGLFIPGFLIILIAVLIFFGNLQLMLFNTIFKEKKIKFYPFVVAIVLGIVGGIMCFDQVLSMNYYDYAPKVNLEVSNSTEIVTAQNTNVYMEIRDSNITAEYKIDASLKDNEIKIDSTHYKDLQNVRVNDKGVYKNYEGIDEHRISLYTVKTNMLTKSQKELNKLFIKNFNNKKIYNYDKLYDSKVTIYTNGKLVIKGA